MSLAAWERNPTLTWLQPPLRELQSNKIPPEPPLLLAKHPQTPQLLLIEFVLQILHQLHCPALNLLQHLNVLPKLRGPELDPGLELRPQSLAVVSCSSLQDAPRAQNHRIIEPLGLEKIITLLPMPPHTKLCVRIHVYLLVEPFALAAAWSSREQSALSTCAFGKLKSQKYFI